jgi:REP element-mobilizing transposase RayT
LFFDAEAEIAKAKGACLPHWHQDGVIYFVTFRLADSLPQEKLKALSEEKEIWLEHHPEPRTPEQKAEYYDRFPQRLQQWLDLGYGSVLLKERKARELVENAITYFDGVRYKLDEFVVAGNHVHVLVAPQGGHTLSDILRSWKSFTSKKLLKLPGGDRLSTAPIVWQRESWDHIVRSEASLNKFREYIRGHRKSS